MAHEHDDLVKHVKAAITHDMMSGLSYDWGIENPRGDLLKQPYYDPDSWQTTAHIKYLDCCAFKYELRCKKPMIFLTNMADYQPTGTTGNGRCCNGKCGMTSKEWKGHEGKLARDPLLGPRGTGAKRKKNSLPPMWIKEFLTHSLKSARPEQRIVIDLCAGWQSLAPVCAQLGLDYIAVDIHGDRNIQIRT